MREPFELASVESVSYVPRAASERALDNLERRLLEAISGGIAPDLRRLDNECASLKDDKKKSACVKEVDGYFATTVRRGRTRNGAVYMPPFEGTLNQEAVWAIKSSLETRREKPL